eukprot:TRINITY_DN91297_c0_g1_i1.p1 TRINITY_DN91297_c0_g1~~TRINITY_DN91297_c0_g1_i1.p1  ORF type:complete len:221 (-),score=42.02 TRINITY_DN91297_c0_g1_i1:23-586(-)
MSTLRVLRRRCEEHKDHCIGEDVVRFLARTPLMRSCSEALIRSAAADGLLELKEAGCTEDALQIWGKGLFILCSGQLRVLNGSGAEAEEVCVLGPGDFLGEEVVLGGSPSLSFSSSQVLTGSIQAVVLPWLRREESQAQQLLKKISDCRKEACCELQARAAQRASWARTKHRIVTESTLRLTVQKAL